MSVYTFSRYRTGTKLALDMTRNGQRQNIPFIYTRRELSKDSEVALIHQVQEGETLDQLAFKYGHDSKLWWVIAEMNNMIGFPLFLARGTQIKIPTSTVFRTAAGF